VPRVLTVVRESGPRACAQVVAHHSYPAKHSRRNKSCCYNFRKKVDATMAEPRLRDEGAFS
jgi:hypothetical protein